MSNDPIVESVQDEREMNLLPEQSARRAQYISTFNINTNNNKSFLITYRHSIRPSIHRRIINSSFPSKKNNNKRFLGVSILRRLSIHTVFHQMCLKIYSNPPSPGAVGSRQSLTRPHQKWTQRRVRHNPEPHSLFNSPKSRRQQKG